MNVNIDHEWFTPEVDELCKRMSRQFGQGDESLKEELLSEIYIAVCESEVKAIAYLYAVARNASIDYVRSLSNLPRHFSIQAMGAAGAQIDIDGNAPKDGA